MNWATILICLAVLVVWTGFNLGQYVPNFAAKLAK